VANETDVNAAIERLATALTQDAIGSIDHATNAKAIAISSDLVINRLRELLSADHRLKEISAITGYGSSLQDFRLQFRFQTDDMIDLSDNVFIVSVDLPTRSVKRIVDPSEAIGPSALNVPLSVAIPSQVPLIKTPLTELQNRFNRTRAFFRDMPLTDAEQRLRRHGYTQALRSGDATMTDQTFVSNTWVTSPATCMVNTTVDTNGTTDDQTDEVNDTAVEIIDDQYSYTQVDDREP